MAELYTEAELTQFAADLERVDADIAALTAGSDRPFDHGELQLAPGKRPGALTGAQLDRFAVLNLRRDALLHRLGRPGREQRAAELREEREALASLDLRTLLGACDEVCWKANGVWYPVVRWSEKSVTVRMEHGDERLTPSEIAGARAEGHKAVTL